MLLELESGTFWTQYCHLLSSGRPRRISTEWNSRMTGCKALIKTDRKRARRCIHIFPTIRGRKFQAYGHKVSRGGGMSQQSVT